NSQVSMYNKRLFDEAKIEFDPITWTFDDLKKLAVAITEANDGKVFGTDDNTADWGAFGNYAGEKGFASQYDGKKLSFPQALVEEYWQVWKDMRDARATPPGADSAGVVSPELNQLGVVTGKPAISCAWSNQMVGTQARMKDTLGAAMRPHIKGGKPGQSIQPTQLVCRSSDTADTDAAI